MSALKILRVILSHFPRSSLLSFRLVNQLSNEIATSISNQKLRPIFAEITNDEQMKKFTEMLKTRTEHCLRWTSFRVTVDILLYPCKFLDEFTTLTQRTTQVYELTEQCQQWGTPSCTTIVSLLGSFPHLQSLSFAESGLAKALMLLHFKVTNTDAVTLTLPSLTEIQFKDTINDLEALSPYIQMAPNLSHLYLTFNCENSNLAAILPKWLKAYNFKGQLSMDLSTDSSTGFPERIIGLFNELIKLSIKMKCLKVNVPVNLDLHSSLLYFLTSQVKYLEEFQFYTYFATTNQREEIFQVPNVIFTIPGLPRLTALEIGTPPEFVKYIAPIQNGQFPNLRDITFANYTRHHHWLPATTIIPSVESLDISNYRDASVNESFHMTLPNLRTLKLNFDVFNIVVEPLLEYALAKFVNIHVLELNWNPILRDEFLNFLSGNSESPRPSTSELIRGCDQWIIDRINWDPPCTQGNRQCLGNLKRLRKLSLKISGQTLLDVIVWMSLTGTLQPLDELNMKEIVWPRFPSHDDLQFCDEYRKFLEAYHIRVIYKIHPSKQNLPMERSGVII